MAMTYRLQSNGCPTMYLKISPKFPKRDLLGEKQVIEWLSGKLPVAEMLAFGEDHDYEYLLTSEVPGENAAELAGRINGAELVTLLAQGLRMVHGVDASDCPFDRSLGKEIEIAEFNVEHQLVDESDFDDIRRGMTADELFKELLRLKPASEDVVFTHGDFCLPNIMISDNKISGFIDLHRAGVGDRYRDIALAVRSIERNLGGGFDKTFFAEYGLARPDYQKMEYYMLLDEFF
jgi:aminoglycoside phosphotransferase